MGSETETELFSGMSKNPPKTRKKSVNNRIKVSRKIQNTHKTNFMAKMQKSGYFYKCGGTLKAF